MLGVAKHWQCFVDQPPYHSHEKVVATKQAGFFDQAVAVHSLVCDLGEVNCTPSRHKGMSEGDLAGHLHHLHGGHRCSLLIQDCHLQVSLTPIPSPALWADPFTPQNRPWNQSGDQSDSYLSLTLVFCPLTHCHF